ncbi:MAG: phosphopantothenate/pantothenate synthetase [Nanoarchaeota archaeon]|nr:phosphopantothenate/pantothenate synthetase [Nanoarchaeota archaeon]
MVPKSHPRYSSLKIRDRIVAGVKKGITSEHGLLAHGRGEAFDYMIGEKTNAKAKQQIKKAAILLKKANHPVISVNGNVAALVPKQLVQLSKAIPAPLEVNIFHPSKAREKAIAKHLKKHGAREVLLPNTGKIKYIESNRRFCNKEGQAKADVIFVPLEDGDRCEALIKMKKKVITIDLNEKSRTAKKATITIVDNVIRAMPLLIKELKN